MRFVSFSSSPHLKQGAKTTSKEQQTETAGSFDQSFVRDITTDKRDAVMVKTIIDMAQNFSLNVIAEGVETEAQRAFLAFHGCHNYQGYLFGKAMPVVEFERCLRR